ncbi:MAG: sugar transferase [Candidatus Glassbacteria bacterium]|nr:sugar transferase [Candidatus Glassbacteria bacterium]
MNAKRNKPGPVWIASDVAAAEAAFFTAVLIRWGGLYPIPPYFSGWSYLFYAAMIAAIYLPVLWALGIGRERVPSVLGLFKAGFVLSVLVTVLPFYFRDYAFSRLVVLLFCLLTALYGLAWRFAAQLILDLPFFAPLARERVLLAAAAGRIADLMARLEASAARVEPVALAVEGDAGLPKGLPSGSLDEAERLAATHRIDLVLLDPEDIEPARWLPLAEKLAALGVELRLVPRSDQAGGRGPSADVMGDPGPLVEPVSGFPALLKRVLDTVISLFVLVIACPLLLAITLAIRFSSPGAVLYRQERVGRHGITFEVRKFRTMVPEAERETGPVWSGRDDARVLPGVGRFLRRTGLDELPQFWNVLTGRMSLVGPRPERPFFFDSYPELYRGRLAVRPGLTGLAQVSCRETTSVSRKVQHDLYYIRNWSLGLDVEILWLTFVMLVRQEFRILTGKNGAESGGGNQQ